MHKSIQEYLAAEYIVRLPSLPDTDVIEKLGDEMAIAVAGSSSPSTYLIALIKHINNGDDREPAFLRTFIQRLQLEKPILDYHRDLVVIAFLELATLLINNGRRIVHYLPRRRLREQDLDVFDMVISPMPETRTKEVVSKYFRKTPRWESEGGMLVTARGIGDADGISVIVPAKFV